MSNHKPATLLPWVSHSANKSSNFGNFEAHIRTVSGIPLIAKARGGQGDTEEAANQNAAYITHAANAYPELVEAVQNLCNSPLLYRHHQAADALLRRLGELE